MHESVRRIAEWAQGRPVGPYRLEVELTNLCNLTCAFCWQQDQEVLARAKQSPELTAERWLRLVEEAAALDVRYWQIAGAGEPLCRRDVADALMFAIKEHGMEGFLITNGTLLSEQTCRRLVELGWETIEFSIDAPDAETHDSLRGVKGAFAKAVTAVENLLLARRQFRTTKPRIQITSVVTNRIHNRISSLVEFACRTGIEKVSLNPLIVCSPAGESLKLTTAQERELQQSLREAEVLARKNGLDQNFRDLIDTGMVEHSGAMQEVITEDIKRRTKRNPYHRAACFSPFHVLEIRPDGRIGPCCIHHGPSDNVSAKTLAEVWFGTYMQRFREDALNGRLPEFCRNCATGLVMENRRIAADLEPIID